MGRPKADRVKEHDAAVKRQKAIELKRTGMSLDDIVATGLYASRGAVSNAITQGMRQARQEMFGEAELYRAQQLDRLEALLRICWPYAMTGSYQHIAEARRIVGDIKALTVPPDTVRIEIGEGDVNRLLASIDAQLEQLLGAGPAALEGEVVDGEVEADPVGAAQDD
jgi:hypothetical protein